MFIVKKQYSYISNTSNEEKVHYAKYYGIQVKIKSLNTNNQI